MNFKKVTLEDKPILDKYLKNNEYMICDFSFANVYIWRNTYHTEFAIHKDFLILRGKVSNDDFGYLMPLGNGDVKEVILDMVDFSKSQNAPFKMLSITEEMEVILGNILSDKFLITNPNDFCDYIYLSDDLINLTGKKYSAKRNHINKFMGLYGDSFEYVSVDETNISECDSLNVQWCEEKGCDNTSSEYCATKSALTNFKALELKGGAIKVDGKMVAFSLGQESTPDVFDVIIEKALTDYEGSYPMINREFAKAEASKYKYINREEDMGVAGLKKAKLSYYPIIILSKQKGVLAL